MAKEHLGRYRNSWDCLGRVLREEGPAALTAGLGPTMWRNTIWNAAYYGAGYAEEGGGRQEGRGVGARGWGASEGA